jgi:hypothetical protein
VEFTAGERLWDALFNARAAGLPGQVADLEDAVFRYHLPMARTLAHSVAGATPSQVQAAEEAAELGLAVAVLEWRQRTSVGFRRFARSAVTRQLCHKGSPSLRSAFADEHQECV